MLFDFLNNIFDKNPQPKPKKRKNTEGVKKSQKTPPEQVTWEVNGQDIPVEIYREWRNGWRYNFAKGRLLVRLPHKNDLRFDENQILNTIKESLEKKTTKKPHLLEKYEPKNYQDNEAISVGSRTYYLKIETVDKKTHSAKLDKNRVVHISLAPQNTEGVVSTLLSRIVAKDNIAEFTRRVQELNHQFFKKNIKSVRFKHNHSNWGSCSSSGNLNFSTRLLFAPEAVQDYVIIHELSHLIELNHSDRFWKLVADAMPDYKEKEKWLRKNSHLCRF